MIDKKLFLKAIDTILESRKKMDKLCNALELCSPGCHCDAFIYSEYEDLTVNLLKDALNDIDDCIGYFLYEMPNFSAQERDDVLVENPEMGSAELLYDYLVEKAKTL